MVLEDSLRMMQAQDNDNDDEEDNISHRNEHHFGAKWCGMAFMHVNNCSNRAKVHATKKNYLIN